jgi:hypothetical protein
MTTSEKIWNIEELGEEGGGDRSEASRLVTKFRKCKMLDSAMIREFYSLLRAAVKGPKAVGNLKRSSANRPSPASLARCLPWTGSNRSRGTWDERRN